MDLWQDRRRAGQYNDFEEAIPKKGKDDRMIAAKRDDPCVMLAVSGNGNEWFTRQRVITERRECWPVKEFLVTVLDLSNGKLVFIRSDGDITAVNDLEASQKGVDSEGDVVASVQSQTT